MKTFKPPMTKETAIQQIAKMRSQTKDKSARRIVLDLALGPHGNLSEGAKEAYRAALNETGFVA